MKKWIKTDGTQFIHKVNNTTFEVVEVVGTEEAGYKISQQIVNVDNLSEEHVQDIIEMFGYKNVKEIKKIYGKEMNQIIAECEAETNWQIIENLGFDTEDGALDYIEQEIIHSHKKDIN